MGQAATAVNKKGLKNYNRVELWLACSILYDSVTVQKKMYQCALHCRIKYRTGDYEPWSTLLIIKEMDGDDRQVINV